MSVLRADWVGIREAVDAIRNGYIVAYPTETFYGLGADPFNERAIERLFELKGRSEDKPIPLLIPYVEMLKVVAKEVPPMGERLVKAFWPGPLTLVFKTYPSLPDALTGGTGKIGVRVSSNPIAQRLVEYLNAPLTTTSANPSGKKGPITPDEVKAYFGDKVAIILDGGKLSGKKGSTVVDVTGVDIEVIRKGEIAVEDIKAKL